MGCELLCKIHFREGLTKKYIRRINQNWKSFISIELSENEISEWRSNEEYFYINTGNVQTIIILSTFPKIIKKLMKNLTNKADKLEYIMIDFYFEKG